MMRLLKWLVWRSVRLLLDLIVVMVVFALIPGLPPHVTYNAYERLPPPLPLEGGLARNTKLNSAQRILDGRITGPESIASRANDEVFVSLHGGKILRLWGPRFDHFKIVTSIGPGCDGPWQEKVCGRPLGLRFGKDGRLLVADAYLGLFSVDVDTGDKELLFNVTEKIDGAAPMLPDDLDVDNDGNIYWSDASSVSHLCDSMTEMLSDPSGRIIKFDPKTGTNTVLVKNIHFANGVQLSPDQDFLIFSETFKFRVLRYWLKGPKAGQSEVFVDRLPGFPDNIRPREDGGYYISLVSYATERNQQLGSALGPLSFVRKLILRLMTVTKRLFEFANRIYPSVYIEKLAQKTLHLQPVTSMTIRQTNLTIVVEVDADGKIVDSLQGDSGKIVLVSETQKIGENLFFGSPYNNYLGRLLLNPPAMEVEGKGIKMKTGGTDEDKENKEKTGDESPGELLEKETQVTVETQEKDAEVKSESETEKGSHEKTVPDTKEEL